MAKSRPHFTGRLPTRGALQTFAHWRPALELEGTPGCDESTIIADEDQQGIGPSVTHATATITTPDGAQRLAVLTGDDLWEGTHEASGLYVLKGAAARYVELVGGYWWPSSDGPTFQYYDFAHFPLCVATQRPSRETGRRLQLVLLPSGEVRLDAAKAPKVASPTVLHVKQHRVEDLGALLDDASFRMYRVRNGRRRAIGETTRCVRPNDGGRTLTLSTAMSWVDDDGERMQASARETFASANLETQRAVTVLSGSRSAFSRTGRGATHLPPGTFGDGTCLLQSLALTAGREFAAPFFSPRGHVALSIFRILGQADAPGSRGRASWHVWIHSGGLLEHEAWLDATTRQLLAFRMSSRDGRVDQLSIRNA